MERIDKDDLEVIEQGSQNIISHKRISKKTKDKNDAYYDAVEKHNKDCGAKGGFIKNSGHHYDRKY